MIINGDKLIPKSCKYYIKWPQCHIRADHHWKNLDFLPIANRIWEKNPSNLSKVHIKILLTCK